MPLSKHKTIIAGAGVILCALVVAVLIVLLSSRPQRTQATSTPPMTWDAQTRRKIAAARQAAQTYLHKGKLAQAQAILEQLLEQYTAGAQAHLLVGKVRLSRDKPVEAYQHFLRSLELDPQQPEVHALAGTLAFEMGKVRQARAHYQKAAELDPENPQYPLYLAQVLLELDRPEEARIQLLRALRLDSTLSTAYATLAILAAKEGKPHMALDQINKAIAHAKSHTRKYAAYHVQKAKYLRRLNLPGQALNVLQTLPPSQQQQPPVLRSLARTYLMLSKPEKAAGIWALFFSLYPQNAEAAARAGLALLRADQQERARDFYHRARRVDPDKPTVLALREALKEITADSSHAQGSTRN